MLMDHVVDLIKKRRSIRKFSPRHIDAAVIREILEAAQWAPSAHNAQPWRFIVLTDAALKRDLAEAMATARLADMTKDGVAVEVRENATKASIERFTSAPVLVVACFTMKDMPKRPDELRQQCERDLAVQSLGAAVQNILLMTHARGLGACWFSAPCFCKETVRKVLKMPKDVEPQALIALGYPAEKPKAPSRKPLHSYAYFDSWGEKL